MFALRQLRAGCLHGTRVVAASVQGTGVRFGTQFPAYTCMHLMHPHRCSSSLFPEKNKTVENGEEKEEDEDILFHQQQNLTGTQYLFSTAAGPSNLLTATRCFRGGTQTYAETVVSPSCGLRIRICTCSVLIYKEENTTPAVAAASSICARKLPWRCR